MSIACAITGVRWRRLGQSKGRGRDDPQRQCSQSPKDVWVYELHPQARAALQTGALEVLAPRSVFAPPLPADWAEEEMAGVALGDQRLNVYVPRSGDRPARTATLELRWKELEVKPPAVALKKSWPSLKLYALRAQEVDLPKGVEPIDWLLLTTWPIRSVKMARRLVRWYALRWGIECWHKVLKIVCGVERRQMKSAEALERALAFDMIVASRVLLLTRLGKEHPDLPAKSFYRPDELDVLAVKKNETTRFAASPQLTVLQANILTAMLGGFWGRPSDGHPGPKVLSEGIRVLQALVWYKQQCAIPVRPGARKAHPT